jgi:hypothetical protein
MDVDRTIVTFSATVGGSNPPPQSVLVTEATDGFMFFHIAWDWSSTWLNVSPRTGLAPCPVVFTALVGTLPAGTYIETVPIRDYHGITETNITVTLVVSDAPPPPGPPIAPINRQLWLGYFRVNGRYGNFTYAATLGAGNCAVVLPADFDPTEWDESEPIKASAYTLQGLGAGIITEASTAAILELTGIWNNAVALHIHEPGSDVPQALWRLEQRIRDFHNVLWQQQNGAHQLTNRPILAIFTAEQIDHPDFYVPDGVDWIGIECYVSYPCSPGTLADWIQSKLSKLAALGSQHPRVLIAQACDRGDAGWVANLPALAALQAGYADVARANTLVKGILWFNYAEPGGTLNYATYLRPYHEAIYHATLEGRPPVEKMPYPAYGFFDECSSTQFRGWAFDPDALNTPIEVQVWDRPRRAPSATRIATLTANEARPDIMGVTHDAGNHGFHLQTPGALKDNVTRSIWVYGTSTPLHYGSTLYLPLAQTPQPLTVPPDPVLPSPHRLIVEGRGFARDGARILYDGITWFAGQQQELVGEDQTARFAWLRSHGVRVLRVLGMAQILFDLGPHQGAAYWNALTALMTKTAAADLIIEYVPFADADMVPNMLTYAQRVAHLQAIARHLIPYTNVMVELCNEPWINGFPDPVELIQLGSIYKAIDPYRLISLGSEGEGMDNVFNQPPADYLTFHSPRVFGSRPYWSQLHSDYPPVLQQNRPPISDEPPNAGWTGRDNAELVPGHWYHFGVMGRLYQFSETFHYGAGKWCQLPTGDALACFDMWRMGQDDLDFDLGGTLYERGIRYHQNHSVPFLDFSDTADGCRVGSSWAYGLFWCAGPLSGYDLDGTPFSGEPRVISGWTWEIIRQVDTGQFYAGQPCAVYLIRANH